MEKLGIDLAKFFSVGDAMERKKHLNRTKMTVFLFINTIKKIDAMAVRAQQQQQGQHLKKRIGGKQTDAWEQYPEWDENRTKALLLLYNIMALPLEKLWSPPLAEENFVK